MAPEVRLAAIIEPDAPVAVRRHGGKSGYRRSAEKVERLPCQCGGTRLRQSKSRKRASPPRQSCGYRRGAERTSALVSFTTPFATKCTIEMTGDPPGNWKSRHWRPVPVS